VVKYPSVRPLAIYASDPNKARGRAIAQPSASERSPFQRDKDRIIHSSAFRRLKGKTQVFVAHEGDYYRTRLTHSIEVSQIARSIARVLGLDEDLAECLALAHDLGHPPFGHSGEDALAACMEPYGGFDHNAQTLRIVTHLEGRYAEFDGLNLTWETLEGIAKHNGPLVTKPSDVAALPWAMTAIPDWKSLELETFAGPEAQVAALADDIAYNNHDLDDGLSAGLFSVEDVTQVPFVGEMFHDVRRRYPDISENRLIHEAVRDMIHAVVDFSEGFRAKEKPLRSFLYDNMYKHFKVNRMMSTAGRVVRELFDLFILEPQLLPKELFDQTTGPETFETARVVCDYIAAMTDTFAISEHKKLYQPAGYF